MKTKKANLWGNSDNENATISIWTSIASRYASSTVVAGYDLLSEPSAPQDSQLQSLYTRLIAEIRTIDPNHMIFLEGNDGGTDFGVFSSRWVLSTDNNTAYSCQLYSDDTCPPITDYKSSIDSFFANLDSVVSEDDLPVYVSEFGGSCESWVQAAVASMQSSNYNYFQQIATYWTYKGIVSSSASFDPVAYEIVDSSNWDSLLGLLAAGTFATDSQWNEAFKALQYSNFQANTKITNVLSDFFAGTAVTYSYTGWWVWIVIIGVCVLIAVVIVIAGVCYWKRHRRNYGFGF